MKIEEKKRKERQEGNYLLVPELDQTRLILHNLVSLGLAILEQLRQRKPLPCHLISIILIYELIVVHAVRRIAPHLLDGWLAAVEVEDVVDEGLAFF